GRVLFRSARPLGSPAACASRSIRTSWPEQYRPVTTGPSRQMWWGRTMTQIDTVIFDFGQVLVRWDPRQVWQGEYSPEEIDQLLEELDFSAINRALDACGHLWAQGGP